MKIDHATEVSILYDFYGKLLPQKQKEIFSFYYSDNLSLSEIGEDLGMSKQGVHDALKKAESTLEKFEAELGLEKNSKKNEQILIQVKAIVDRMIDHAKTDKDIKEELIKIDHDLKRLNI